MTSRPLRVTFEQQVIDFVRKQAPDPRRRLRLALRDLSFEKGNIKALEGELEGLHRLSVGSFRVIFAYEALQSGAVIKCVFVERRSIVYVMLERMISEGLALGR